MYPRMILICLATPILSHNVWSVERKPFSGLMQGSRVFETRHHPYVERITRHKIKPRIETLHDV